MIIEIPMLFKLILEIPKFYSLYATDLGKTQICFSERFRKFKAGKKQMEYIPTFRTLR